MAETERKGKLERSALLHYLDTTFSRYPSHDPEWYLIGKNVQDMSVELNSEVESTTNILDETQTIDNGYTPSIDVDTYYAEPSDGAFYDKIKDIAMNRRTGDACKTQILEVLVDSTSNSYDAWIEEVIVKPKSYGGATGGVRIPYTINFCGNRAKGHAAFTKVGNKRSVEFSENDSENHIPYATSDNVMFATADGKIYGFENQENG